MAVGVNSRRASYIAPRYDAEAIMLDNNPQDQTLCLKFL
jgi:hypothetical protein